MANIRDLFAGLIVIRRCYQRLDIAIMVDDYFRYLLAHRAK